MPGLYFYDNGVVEIARHLQPSRPRRARDHRRQRRLPRRRAGSRSTCCDRGTAWLDTGTFDSLMQPASSSRSSRSGRASRSAVRRRSPGGPGFLSDDELRARAEPLTKSGYGDYLLGLLAAPLAAGQRSARGRRARRPTPRPTARPRRRSARRRPAPGSCPSTEYAGRGAGRTNAAEVGLVHPACGSAPAASATAPREAVPGRLAAGRRVVGPGGRLRREQLAHELGDVPRPGRLAHLVVDDVQGRALGRARPRWSAGSRPVGAVQPGRPHDQGVRAERRAPPTRPPPWSARTPRRGASGVASAYGVLRVPSNT